MDSKQKSQYSMLSTSYKHYKCDYSSYKKEPHQAPLPPRLLKFQKLDTMNLTLKKELQLLRGVQLVVRVSQQIR